MRDRFLRRVNILLKCRHLRLRGDDVNRGEHSFFDETLVALDLKARLLDGINLHLKIAQRES